MGIAKTSFAVPLLALGALALSACRPGESSAPAANPAQAVTRALETAATNCQTQLRAKMQSGDLRFVPSPNWDRIANVDERNRSLEQFVENRREFGLRYVSGNLRRVSVTRFMETSARTVSVQTSLAVADPAYPFLFTLTIELESTDVEPARRTNFSETFQISDACVSRLTEASVASRRRDGNQAILEAETSTLSDRSRTVTPVRLSTTLPAGGRLQWEQTSPSYLETVAFAQRQPVFIIGSDGSALLLLVESVRGGRQLKDPVDGGERSATEIDFAFPLGGAAGNYRELAAQSDDRALSLVRDGSVDVWTLPAGNWARAVLRPEVRARMYDIAPDRRAQAAPTAFEIETDRDLKYDNLSAYWTIESKTPVTDPNSRWRLRHRARPIVWSAADAESAPLVTDDAERARNRDLAASDRVQVDLPEIQAIARELLAANPGANRLQMAEKVRAATTSRLSYDTDSIDDAAVSTLDTAQILRLRKGVCQHFAVLFAAIARAVGIPTRIIVGFHVATPPNVVGHAWNEVETRPGQWRPIEPEDRDLSFASAAEYVPMRIGYELESDARALENFREIQEESAIQFRVRY